MEVNRQKSDGSRRMLYSSSWYDYLKNCYSDCRRINMPDLHFSDFNFRIVCN